MADPNAIELRQAGAPSGQEVSFLVKLLIVVFALGYMTFAMYVVADCWALNHETLKRILGLPADAKLPALFVSATYTMLGSLLGIGVLDIVSFHRHVAVKRNFELPHVWGYFVGPWLAAILGLIVFALLQSGLLVFAGGSPAEPKSDVTNLGYLAVGFLSGYGWFQAIERIRELISRFFTPSRRNEELKRSSPSASAVSIQQGLAAEADTPGEGKQDVRTRDSAAL